MSERDKGTMLLYSVFLLFLNTRNDLQMLFEI